MVQVVGQPGSPDFQAPCCVPGLREARNHDHTPGPSLARIPLPQTGLVGDMAVFHIAVGVALQRPPLIDEFRYVLVSAGCETEARGIALQITATTSVMPVWDGWPDDVAHLPEGWIRQ